MVVDHRIDGLEFDRLLQMLGGAVEIAEPVEHPAQAVDDIAVVGALLDGLLDHRLRLGEILAHLDPAVAEIVQHQRLVGLELQRLEEIDLGAGPLLGALEGDAALVEQRPVALFGVGDQRQGAVIGGTRFGEPAVPAQHFTERGMRLDRARIRRHRVAKRGDALVDPARTLHRLGPADLGV